jgi:hypothetical protein
MFYMDGNEEGLERVMHHMEWELPQDEMLPAAAAWVCGKQHQSCTEVYATSIDSAAGA